MEDVVIPLDAFFPFPLSSFLCFEELTRKVSMLKAE